MQPIRGFIQSSECFFLYDLVIKSVVQAYII